MWSQEDPLTGYTPSRVALDEEEEQAAESKIHLYTEPPVLLWSPDAVSRLQDGRLPIKTLVVVASRELSPVLQPCCSTRQVVGSVILPDISAPASASGPRPRDPAGYLYLLPGDVLVAQCDFAVPVEQCNAWARGLMSSVAPEWVVVLGVMPAQHYLGDADPTQETISCVMENPAPAGSAGPPSAGAATGAPNGNGGAAAPRHGIPLLPPGHMVLGQPAALMSYCMARQMRCSLLVSYLSHPKPGGSFLLDVSRRLQQLLSSAGVEPLPELLHATPDRDAYLPSTASTVYI